MFLNRQSKEQVSSYEQLLRAVGSLSRLFSEAPEPYLAYRAAEKVFCKAFGAEDLSRSDASADASKDRLGFGIKTFLEGNKRSMQKVAEFNSDHSGFRALDVDAKVRKIAELRNERLATTKRIFGLDDIIYHCVARQVGKIVVFETPAHPIDINAIKDITTGAGGNTIQFSDPHDEYSFSVSKSTLLKRFVTDNVLLEVPVRILEDPFADILKLIEEVGLIFAPIRVQPHVILPLYSKRGEKHVPERSGLNQWNAAGRPRDHDEIYIPIPAWIHTTFPRFFPPRDQAFELTLPDRTTMSAKVCQDNSKALMSNPNAALGKWLLRDVMNLKPNELLTYDKLQTIGLDSVVVYKIDNNTYDIDFTKIGSFENFLAENGTKADELEVEVEDDE
jgi:hypothetical protein